MFIVFYSVWRNLFENMVLDGGRKRVENLVLDGARWGRKRHFGDVDVRRGNQDLVESFFSTKFRDQFRGNFWVTSGVMSFEKIN